MGVVKDMYLMSSSFGYGFVNTLEDMKTRNKAGKAVLKLAEGATVLPAIVVRSYDEEWIVAISSEGHMLVTPLAELPQMARGKGNKIINIPSAKLKDGSESVVVMELIKDGEKFAVLSDILGDEDHLGDMDFKVAGTTDGICALQMDIKIDGITKEIMEKALEQAKAGRNFILGEMNKVISETSTEMSEYAPRYLNIKIHPDKIRDVIGKGGAVIRVLTEETGATIDIDDDGNIKIASSDLAAAEEAKKRIEQITSDAEVGVIYNGTVKKIMDFGAFVEILPGKDGLVHISQISDERVEKVSDKLSEGDVVKVKVLEIDRQVRIRLSMKEVEEAAA